MARWPLRLAPAVAFLLVVAPACSPEGRRSAGRGASRAEIVTLHVFNVRLDARAEPGFQRLRLFFHSRAPMVDVTITGGVDEPNRSIRVCPLATQIHDPDPATCQTPPSAVTVKVPHGRQYRGVEVRHIAPDAEGDSAVDVHEVAVRYRTNRRSATVLLPNLAPPREPEVCRDNACNPFLELTPRRAGPFKAKATWEEVGTATLTMETGEVSEKALSTRGLPYTIVASGQASSESGPPDLRIEGRLDDRTEAALALRNVGARVLVSPKVEVEWP